MSDLLKSEYKLAVSNLHSGASNNEITSMLIKQHDWTDEGARVILDLAQRYGVFVLRNALSLAEALDIEDGEIGL